MKRTIAALFCILVLVMQVAFADGLFPGTDQYGVTTLDAAASDSNASTTRVDIQAGQYLTFGHYPQTKSGNDNSPIEWLVLDKDDQSVLLISRYALDCQNYNDSFENITWQECTLRSWLNETFMNKAFTDSEQKGLLTTNVNNNESQGYSKFNTSGGSDTQDKVFLLSYAEAWEYFKDDIARMCIPTEYTIQQGAYTSSNDKVQENATCVWWLRSPGNNQRLAMLVFSDGSRSVDSVSRSIVAVRPAIRVDLDSGLF